MTDPHDYDSEIIDSALDHLAWQRREINSQAARIEAGEWKQ